MIWLHKLLRLAPSQRFLVIEAAITLAAVHGGLRLVSFREMNRLVRHINRAVLKRTRDSKQNPDLMIWALDRVGSVLLGQNACLTIALAGQFLLARHGIPSRLRIGVKKTDDGNLLAHAWLVGEQGIILVGEFKELQRFVVLPDLDSVGT